MTLRRSALAETNSASQVNYHGQLVLWFGSIGRSMQTLFTIQTLAGWDPRQQRSAKLGGMVHRCIPCAAHRKGGMRLVAVGPMHGVWVARLSGVKVDQRSAKGD